jgi:hypothetical protein
MIDRQQPGTGKATESSSDGTQCRILYALLLLGPFGPARSRMLCRSPTNDNNIMAIMAIMDLDISSVATDQQNNNANIQQKTTPTRNTL